MSMNKEYAQCCLNTSTLYYDNKKILKLTKLSSKGIFNDRFSGPELIDLRSLRLLKISKYIKRV